MLDGVSGAADFSLSVAFRSMCSRKRRAWLRQSEERVTPTLASLIMMTPVIVLGQYVLGGALRHLHTMLDEHIAGAAIVSVCGASSAFALMRSQNGLLRQSGFLVAFALLLQLMLGAGSYLTKFGLPQIGYVAVSGSLSQTVVCSMHTVFGMFLLSVCVVAATSLAVLYRTRLLHGLRIELPTVEDRGTIA